MRTAYKSIRLFESEFLEWFSHIHPLTPLFIWVPVATWLIWHGYSQYDLGYATIALLGVLGLLTWSLAEYLLHRFVFHFEPKTPSQDRLVFIMHGIHHADPFDPTRLVMAPPVAIVLALIFYPIFRALLGPALSGPFFGFFIVGYLCYDYVHYSVHHFTPRTRVGRALKQSHMIHHYVNHDLRWGVSSPLWDWAFGTLSEPVPVKKPKTSQKQNPVPAASRGLKRAGKTKAGRKGKAAEASFAPLEDANEDKSGAKLNPA